MRGVPSNRCVDSKETNNCVVLNPDKKISKADYLLSLESELIVLVGDSESEYNAVKNGNVQVVMVSTGLRCSSHFAPTKKLLVINDINDFLTSFKEKK